MAAAWRVSGRYKMDRWQCVIVLHLEDWQSQRDKMWASGSPQSHTFVVLTTPYQRVGSVDFN